VQPEARVARKTDFFIWIRRNPLKSPESAEGIQGNPSFFAWISLDFAWINLALVRLEVVAGPTAFP
jgi:hypothetical protein